jgi:nitrogen fixation NifU-like protein
MSDIDNLYKQVIMDHYKSPKNKGLVDDDKYQFIHLNNPSCGDDMNIQMVIENDTIKDIKEEPTGCSISCSSASVMSELLKNKSVSEARQIIDIFYKMITANPITLEEEELLGEAIAYKGVCQFPARVKCATLAWKAAERALNGERDERKKR